MPSRPHFRARVGFQAGTFLNLQLLVEGEGVVHLGDDFNDTVNGNIAYPVGPILRGSN